MTGALRNIGLRVWPVRQKGGEKRKKAEFAEKLEGNARR
jgi:hypothetical protein